MRNEMTRQVAMNRQAVPKRPLSSRLGYDCNRKYRLDNGLTEKSNKYFIPFEHRLLNINELDTYCYNLNQPKYDIANE